MYHISTNIFKELILVEQPRWVLPKDSEMRKSIHWITPTFYVEILLSQKRKKTLMTSLSFCSFEIFSNKAAHNMLVKLTSGLNFINVLLTAFTHSDPKSIKKTIKLSIIFTLLGCRSVEAARKMLEKLTPGVNFINVLWEAFALADQESTKSTVKLSVFFALSGSARE